MVGTDDLGPQDEHLLLADLQLLVGQLELVQQEAVAVWGAGGGVVLGGLDGHGFPQLIQVVLQLLIFRLQLLPLEDSPSETHHHPLTQGPLPTWGSSSPFLDQPAHPSEKPGAASPSQQQAPRTKS